MRLTRRAPLSRCSTARGARCWTGAGGPPAESRVRTPCAERERPSSPRAPSPPPPAVLGPKDERGWKGARLTHPRDTPLPTRERSPPRVLELGGHSSLWAKEKEAPTGLQGGWSRTATNWLFSSLMMSPTRTFIHCSCWRLRRREGRGACVRATRVPRGPLPSPRPSVSSRHSHSIDQHLRLTVIHLVIALVSELKGRKQRGETPPPASRDAANQRTAGASYTHLFTDLLSPRPPPPRPDSAKTAPI